MHGFGFVMDNIVTDTHFDRRSRLARLIPAVRNMNKTYGVGVDEPAVFYLKDDVGIALATEAVFIVDVSQANYRSNKYFKTTGVRVHYLTKGDQFNFTSKKLVTSKPLIS
jgi:cyanophycinase-like exopeptidase